MKKKRIEEHSAGGILVAKSNNTWYVLIMKDQKGVWTFPKGKIEQGEDAQTAALREIAEEVAIIRLTFRAKVPPIHYWYTRNETIYKTVQYFIFEAAQKYTPIPQKEEGITEAKWVKLSRAQDIVGYQDTHKSLLSNVQHILG